MALESFEACQARTSLSLLSTVSRKRIEIFLHPLLESFSHCNHSAPHVIVDRHRSLLEVSNRVCSTTGWPLHGSQLDTVCTGFSCWTRGDPFPSGYRVQSVPWSRDPSEGCQRPHLSNHCAKCSRWARIWSSTGLTQRDYVLHACHARSSGVPLVS